MLLLAHLAKVQGLKGEFLLHAVMDNPGRLPDLEGLLLAPPEVDLEHGTDATGSARAVTVRSFRWHQKRPCVAFEELPDRTVSEPYKGWALWMPEDQAVLDEGESFRHEWVGCDVFLGETRIGEVIRLEPTPMGYDMVLMRDLRPHRTGIREIPYIKAWFTLDLPHRRIGLVPPEGLLDLDRIED